MHVLKESATCGEPALEQAPVMTCGPVERGAHTAEGFLAATAVCGEPTLEQSIPEGLHPVEGTHIEAARGLSPV